MPATTSSTRSTSDALRKSQPLIPAAIVASPITEVMNTLITSAAGACNSRPIPSGCTVNMNGTTNAGSVYFQAIIIVLKGLPPVRAAAAMGDRPTGGDTSDSTA